MSMARKSGGAAPAPVEGVAEAVAVSEVEVFVPPEVPAPPVPVDDSPGFARSLQEYLGELSLSDRRVELLSGFQAFMTAKGVVFGTAALFDAEFQAFVNRPV
jgi:hypothetical protein